MTEPSKHFYLKAKQKSFNIQYRNLIQNRVDALKSMNKPNDAKEELMDLYDNLISVTATTKNEMNLNELL